MRARLFLCALATLALGSPAAVYADPPEYAITVSACGTLPWTPVIGTPEPLSQDTTGHLCSSATGGGGGGGAVTMASGAVASGAYSSGAFAVGSGTDGWDVTLGSKADAATCATTNTAMACLRQLHADLIAALPAGANIIGKVGIDQTTDVTTNGVEIAPTNGAAATPSGYASATAESGHVIQASATNAYRLYAYSTVAGLLMTFNSTTVPADGAVTPVECMPVNAGGFAAHDMQDIPDRYGTGLSVAFSTGTNCFSKTASATAFFKVSYK